jgi:cytochrome c-type protein NapB
MSKKILMALLATPILVLKLPAQAEIATLRDHAPILEQPKTAPMAKPVTDDVKIVRNYPMQPPLIPHKIRGYRVTAKVNTCMACHKRDRVSNTQATMISVTHYMDRDGNFLATISPRRYFCNQCHVAQHAVNPPVNNTFVDIRTLLKEEPKDLH